MCGTGASRQRTFAPAACTRSRGGTSELRRDDRVEGAVRDRDRVPLETAEVELEALHLGHEPGERHDRRRPRPAPPEPERPAHHGALREAAEDDLLEWHGKRVEERGRGFERREERLGIGRRDAAEPVPVRAARRQRERSARRDPEQPSFGVERVEKGVEVVLVGAPAVQEHERPRRRAGGGALEMTKLGRAHELAHAARGSGSGVRTGSIFARRCSKAGGRMSASPRWSASSSIEKPGPRVAISNSTPLGSRK